jgi:DNA-binding NtrC family response regulator
MSDQKEFGALMIATIEPMHILVVDDDNLVLHLLEKIITKDGFRAVLSSNGEEAIRRARRVGNNIRLAIIDYDMPGMDGIMTFHGLRREHPDMKAILYTGNPDIAGLSKLCPPELVCKEKDFDFKALGALMKQLLWTAEPSIAFE